MKTLMNKKFLCGLLAALMLLGILVNLISPVLAEEEKTSGEIKKQLEQIEADQARLEAEIRELESKLRDNLTEMEAMVAQKGIIDNQIFSLQAQVANINEMISSYNVLIADKQEELIKAEERLAQLNAQNKERIRAMDKNVKKPTGAKPGKVIYNTYNTIYVTPDKELIEKLKTE